MRCFIAIELAPDPHRALVKLLQQLPRAAGVRWCTENQLHLTLKFLGEVAEDRLGDVFDAISHASAQIAPFDVRLARLGAFPNQRRPRVLWVGVDDPTWGCSHWLAQADPQFAALGFPAENRSYHPHITLGRGKDHAGSDRMRKLLDELEPPAPLGMTVERVVLFQSELAPSGARYTPLAKINLST